MYQNVRYPRKVIHFDDKLVRIRTLEGKSVLLRLPYKPMIKIMNSFWKDYDIFADFLYTHVPMLSTYTIKIK